MESMRPFELRRPTSLHDAAALLATLPRARVLAGGTDLLPNLRRRIEAPSVLVDLSAIADLGSCSITGGGLAVGARVTLAQLAGDAQIAQRWSALVEAARAVAAPGHRNAATVGGNLCLDTRCIFYNQSEWWRSSNGYCLKRGGDTCHVAPQGAHCHAAFCGDLAPALIVLGAEVELVSTRGTRCIGLADLYQDDGAAHLTLARDEVLARIVLPMPGAGVVSGYRKARARGAIDFPLAGVACALAMRDGNVEALRIALTGTNSRPILLDGTDALLGHPVGEETLAAIGKLVQRQVSPMRTTVTQANYRRQVAAVLARRLVQSLAGQSTTTAEAARP